MGRVKKESSSLKIVSTLTIEREAELNRLRSLLIKFDSMPIDSAILPVIQDDETLAKLQEVWIYGLEIESTFKDPSLFHSYTSYSDILIKTAYDFVKKENVEDVSRDTTTLHEGKYAVFSLGVGNPDQIRLIGPLTEEKLKKFSHPRVFSEFVNVITPVSHHPSSLRSESKILGTVEDLELLVSYTAPMTFSHFLKDYTSGVLLEIGQVLIQNLEKTKYTMAELERANSRLALAKFKKSIAESLIGLGI